jgi:hypothetical protein
MPFEPNYVWKTAKRIREREGVVTKGTLYKIIKKKVGFFALKIRKK